MGYVLYEYGSGKTSYDDFNASTFNTNNYRSVGSSASTAKGSGIKVEQGKSYVYKFNLDGVNDKTALVKSEFKNDYVNNVLYKNIVNGEQYHPELLCIYILGSSDQGYESKYGTSFECRITLTQKSGSSFTQTLGGLSLAVYCTYNANGGAFSGGATTYQEEAVDGRTYSSAPTRAGYNFLGWADSSSATSSNYGTSITYSGWKSSKTVYAVWRKIPNTYTVKYNPNGGTYNGSASTSSVAKTEGDTITLPASNTMSRTGHVFGGWKINGGTTYAAGSSYTVQGNVEFIAQWNAIDYKFTIDCSDAGIQGVSYKVWTNSSKTTSVVSGYTDTNRDVTIKYGYYYELTASVKNGYKIEGSASKAGSMGASNQSWKPVTKLDTYTVTISKGTGVEGVKYKIENGSWTFLNSSSFNLTPNSSQRVYVYPVYVAGYNSSDNYSEDNPVTLSYGGRTSISFYASRAKYEIRYFLNTTGQPMDASLHNGTYATEYTYSEDSQNVNVGIAAFNVGTQTLSVGSSTKGGFNPASVTSDNVNNIVFTIPAKQTGDIQVVFSIADKVVENAIGDVTAEGNGSVVTKLDDTHIRIVTTSGANNNILVTFNSNDTGVNNGTDLKIVDEEDIYGTEPTKLKLIGNSSSQSFYLRFDSKERVVLKIYNYQIRNLVTENILFNVECIVYDLPYVDALRYDAPSLQGIGQYSVMSRRHVKDYYLGDLKSLSMTDGTQQIIFNDESDTINGSAAVVIPTVLRPNSSSRARLSVVVVYRGDVQVMSINDKCVVVWLGNKFTAVYVDKNTSVLATKVVDISSSEYENSIELIANPASYDNIIDMFFGGNQSLLNAVKSELTD